MGALAEVFLNPAFLPGALIVAVLGNLITRWVERYAARFPKRLGRGTIERIRTEFALAQELKSDTTKLLCFSFRNLGVAIALFLCSFLITAPAVVHQYIRTAQLDELPRQPLPPEVPTDFPAPGVFDEVPELPFDPDVDPSSDEFWQKIEEQNAQSQEQFAKMMEEGKAFDEQMRRYSSDVEAFYRNQQELLVEVLLVRSVLSLLSIVLIVAGVVFTLRMSRMLWRVYNFEDYEAQFEALSADLAKSQ